MSAAGDFIQTCTRRGVQILVQGNDVSLRGYQPDVEALVPQLEQCVNDVHALMSGFLYAVPPPSG